MPATYQFGRVLVIFANHLARFDHADHRAVRGSASGGQELVCDCEMSGSQRVSGWINAFFPYILLDSETAPYRMKVNSHALAWRGATDRESGPREYQFPWALSRVPFLWKVDTQQIQMEFAGGFVGISRDQETPALRPVIGWAVQQASP
jgi:hypothetical protein